MLTRRTTDEGVFLKLAGDNPTGNIGATFSNGAGGGWRDWIGVNQSSDGWVKKDLLRYDVDTWYHVRHTMDCVAKKTTFEVSKVGDPSISNSWSTENYCHTYVHWLYAATSWSQGVDCYIDNVTVWDLNLPPIPIPDTTPPEVVGTGDPDTLWPPNHKMVEVEVSILATDEGTPDPEDLFDGLVVLASSDEPDNGLGDGDTDGDVNFEDGFTEPVDVTAMFTLSEDGFFEGTIWLRAERGGGGGGRTYTIEAFVEDAAGNVGSCSCEVKVPHDEGRGKKAKKKK